MQNLRVHGVPPYRVAVLHGGPGAPGSVSLLARELAKERGVLEPLQTRDSVDGQVDELRAVLGEHGDLPLTLIGSSWGAMLGFIFAARHPALVRKLILVGSGVFEERYAAGILDTRLNRLGERDRAEVERFLAALDDPTSPDKDGLMARFGALLTKADAYDPLSLETGELACQYDLHQKVWREARALRISGEFLALGAHIRCPVLAIHGDYDPHPVEGVREPLVRVLADFRFVPLERCGHLPWIERQARERFYRLLTEALPPVNP